MRLTHQPALRPTEGLSLIIIAVLTITGFLSVAAALQVRQRADPLSALPEALFTAGVVIACLAALHILLLAFRMKTEQLILPVVSLLFVTGLLLIWRLRGPDGAWQQLTRGFFPGLVLAAALIIRPRWIEYIRRWSVPIGLVGLALPILTAFWGVVDETGSRLALKIGPLPSIQTSEPIKLALIIFLAWYIERQGQAVEARGYPLFGWLRLPAVEYFIPGVLFVGVATLALVQMSDYGAVLILAAIFVGMLYVGFQSRIFYTVGAIGLVLAVLVGLVLSVTWEVPTVIRYRFMAFQNPWSTEEIVVNGIPTGISIAEGPGYQIQQSVYAIIAGGLTGTGLGFGSPQYVPLAHSDFILAAVMEELGSATGIAVLILFAVLLMRIFRMILLLQPELVFERLLLAGIGIHFFTQVFVMAAGTFNLLPMTGVTVPFMSQGGMALLINLVEVGMVLGIARRMESYEA